MFMNKTLAAMAWQAAFEKAAFVPSDAAAQASGGAPPPGGPPPGDPSGGGAPPGGPPPGDPSAGGPMPPGPGAGMPDAGGGGPDIAAIIQQQVQQALAQQGGMGGGGAAGAGAKPPKPDLNMVATDVFQLKKLVLADMRSRGKELPEGILDGPGRDPNTGMPIATPDGSSGATPPMQDPSQGQPPDSAIKPIDPVQGAYPTAGPTGMPTPQPLGVAPKMASVERVGSSFPMGNSIADKGEAVYRILASRKR